MQKEGEADSARRSFRRSVSAAESSNTGGDGAVWMDVHGMILAFVFGTHCSFRAISNGSVVAEIQLKDTPLLRDEDHAVEARLAGGVFLQEQDAGLQEGAAVRFLMWSSEGAAVVYAITGGALDDSDGVLSFEPICKIPTYSGCAGRESSVFFCESRSCLLRILSCCSSTGGLSIWRPYVTMWSVPDIALLYPESDGSNRVMVTCNQTGEGCFPIGWNELGLSTVKRLNDMHCSDNTEGTEGSVGNHARISEGTSSKAEKCYGRSVIYGHVVTSSMILSENSLAPYAIVNGFDNGDIEVAQILSSLSDLGSFSESTTRGNGSNISRHLFLGHTGAVVCLAAHRMVAKPSKHDLEFALVSGSLDCTVRIWDMNKGNLVAILHHHVGPVRQIILAPASSFRPWNDCFLSVGEDCCIALISLETLGVERMFPGHPSYPSKVVWDSAKGYVACLCRNVDSQPDAVASLCIWDMKSGARERVLRGAACHAMFDHFCAGISVNELTGDVLGGTTSASLLHLPVIEGANSSSYNRVTHTEGKDQRAASVHDQRGGYSENMGGSRSPWLTLHSHYKIKMPAIRCSCPLPGIAVLKFDLASIISPLQRHDSSVSDWNRQANTSKIENGGSTLSRDAHNFANPISDDKLIVTKESLGSDLIRFTLAFLHLWDIDHNLDALLMDGMGIFKPDGLPIASGILGDKGSLMLTFPGVDSALELWKSSAEFSAMRSLTIVSLAQRLITLSHPSSAASSALAAFYTRNFAEKVPSIKPPLLQILVSFWQDTSEHVRMAARSLFHCAAPRAVPSSICSDKIIRPESPSIPVHIDQDYSCLDKSHISGDDYLNTDDGDSSTEDGIISWLESYEMHDWISCISGMPQDAMAAHIIVASALAVWYPSIVKAKVAKVVVQHLIKLVMVVNEFYSSTAAELLSEGMDSTWKSCIGSEIPHLIGDIFFQIECLSGSAASNSKQAPILARNVQEALVGILLPSLAMADITGFLHVIESQIWATSSDSPVHLASLKTLIRVIRGSAKPLIPYLDKVVNFILQTMDPANPAIRKVCFQSSIATLKEVARTFPMVAVDEPFSRLAVGDAVGNINDVTIKIYDLRSLEKVKVLDASGPPGLPILSEAADALITTAISVVSFSPDGEGLVAFSEQGLVIRWWSLGSAWWEKLSRNTVPTQCTKLIFVPPWEGFSSNSSRSSIIASIKGHASHKKMQEKKKESDVDTMKILLQNIDISYRLEWTDVRRVALTRFGHELGVFQF